MKREYVRLFAFAATAAWLSAAIAQDPRESAPDYRQSLAFADYLGEGDLRANELLGVSVYDEQGTEVGSIEDVVVSRKDSSVIAVVSVGGFLNVGEKLVGVPYDEFRVLPEGGAFFLAMRKDELEARPEWSYAKREPRVRADQRSADAKSQDPGRPDTDAVSTEPRAAGKPENAAGSAPSGGAQSRQADFETMARNARRASQLIGLEVVTSEGEEIGSIDDLVVPVEAGDVHAVLSVGGLLGVGARLISVPLSALALPGATDEDVERIRLDMTVAELKDRPIFRYEEVRVSTADPR